MEKVLGQLKDAEREALIEQIKPLLSQLKKFSYGKLEHTTSDGIELTNDIVAILITHETKERALTPVVRRGTSLLATSSKRALSLVPNMSVITSSAL
jgi:hypothetical protein